MAGGNDEAGHWLSTLFTSLRETANFGSLIGGSKNLQGVAGQIQTAMGTNQEFQSIVSVQAIFNEEMSDFENEAFLTSEMERLDLLDGSLQDSKISLGRILATGILGGLSLIAPSMAGFNIYAISKLVGGIANKFSAKLQNRQLVKRNSKMKLLGRIIYVVQKNKMGKTPEAKKAEVLPKTPIVSKNPKAPNPMLSPIRGAGFIGGPVGTMNRLDFGDGRSFGTARQIDMEIMKEVRYEEARKEIARLEELKNSEENREKSIVNQLEEKKQQIFDNIDLSGFDPHDPNLKYPLTDNDNIQSILFKTLLNLIYKNKGTLESVYKGDIRFEFTDDGTLNYKFKDLIRPENLGVILGMDVGTVNPILKIIDSNSQRLTFSAKNRITIRNMRDSTEQIFNHIELKDTQSIIRGLLDNYIKLRYAGGDKFVMQLLACIDDYTDFGILSEKKMATEKLKMYENYLVKFRTEKVHFEQISKYFKLLVNIYISGEFNLGFTDSDKFEEFKKEMTSLIYENLLSTNLIKKTHTSRNKFDAIYLTLIALTNLRDQIPNLRQFKIDNVIERKTNFERDNNIKSNFEKYIEDRQNVLTIPDAINLISVDYTYSSNWDGFIKEKLYKHYQSEDQLLIIVLTGQKSDRTVQELNKKLQGAIKNDDGSNHLENVRIITSKQYGEFLGFDGNYKKLFNIYQDVSFNLFHDLNKLFGAIYHSGRAESWLEGHNEDWIKIYWPQP